MYGICSEFGEKCLLSVALFGAVRKDAYPRPIVNIGERPRGRTRWEIRSGVGGWGRAWYVRPETADGSQGVVRGDVIVPSILSLTHPVVFVDIYTPNIKVVVSFLGEKALGCPRVLSPLAGESVFTLSFLPAVRRCCCSAFREQVLELPAAAEPVRVSQAREGKRGRRIHAPVVREGEAGTAEPGPERVLS